MLFSQHCHFFFKLLHAYWLLFFRIGLGIVGIFSSAFYPPSAFSHPRFILHPHFLIRVLSSIRIFSSAFYPPSAFSHPRFILHPHFLIRIFSSAIRICIRIRVLSLPNRILNPCKPVITNVKVVAKGDAREVGDRELELFQICQSTSLPGLSVNFFR